MPDVRSMVVARTEAVYRRSPRATASSQPDAAMPSGRAAAKRAVVPGSKNPANSMVQRTAVGAAEMSRMRRQRAAALSGVVVRARCGRLAERKRQHRAGCRAKVEPRAASAHGPLQAAAEERALRTLMTDDVPECKRGAASHREQRGRRLTRARQPRKCETPDCGERQQRERSPAASGIHGRRA